MEEIRGQREGGGRDEEVEEVGGQEEGRRQCDMLDD